MQTYDLTDLEMVKAFGGIPTTGARPNQDTKLGLLISAFSRAIGRYCDRQFLGKAWDGDVDATSTISFGYDGNGWLSFSPWEPREIESVTLDGKSLPLYDPTAPEMETYSLLPLQKTTESTYLGVNLPQRERHGQLAVGSYGTVFVGSGYVGQVDVVAKWGIVGVPEDVELATCISVLDAFRNPEGAASRAMGDFNMVEAQGGGNIPAAARALLGPLQRS